MGAGAPPRTIVGCRAGDGPGGRATGVGGPSDRSAYECRSGCSCPFGCRCGLDVQTGEVLRTRLTPVHGDVIAWLESLPGPVKATYEAGPTGFGLARALEGGGDR